MSYFKDISTKMIMTSDNLDVGINNYCIGVLHNQLRVLIHKFIINPYNTFILSCPIVPYFEDESIQGDGLEQRKQHIQLIFKRIYEDELWYMQKYNISSANPELIKYDNLYISVIIADNLSIIIKFRSAIIAGVTKSFNLNASLYLQALRIKILNHSKSPVFIILKETEFVNNKAYELIPKGYIESELKKILLKYAAQYCIPHNIIDRLSISQISTVGISKYFIKFEF